MTTYSKHTSVADEPSSIELVDFEPFAEFPDLQYPGCASAAFRFGYRCKRTGVVIATVQIPASTVAQSIQLKIAARVTTDGKIVAESEIQNDGALIRSSEAVSLAELIEETLHTNNLRREEANPHELKRMLEELEISTLRVKTALTAMDLGAGVV